jgi:hypothetical protein
MSIKPDGEIATETNELVVESLCESTYHVLRRIILRESRLSRAFITLRSIKRLRTIL